MTRQPSFSADYSVDTTQAYNGDTVTWTLAVHNPTTGQMLVDYDLKHPIQLGAEATVDAAGTYGYSGDGSHDAGADRITLPAGGTGALTFEYTISSSNDNQALTSVAELTEVLGTTIDSQGNTITQSDPVDWRTAPTVYLNYWGRDPRVDEILPNVALADWIFNSPISAARVADAIADGRTLLDVISDFAGDADTLDGIDSTSFWRNDDSSGHPDQVALGLSSVASGLNAVAVGESPDATGADSIAIGSDAQGGNTNAIAIGHDASASGSGAIMIGAGGGTATGISAIAIGGGADATGTSYAIAVGWLAQAIGNDTIAMGSQAGASASNAISIGHDSDATAIHGVALGYTAQSLVDSGVAIGYLANVAVAATYGVAVGRSADVDNSHGVAIGYNTAVTGNYGIAIGRNSSATAAGAAALGDGVTAATANTTSVNNLEVQGATATVNGQSVALEYDPQTVSDTTDTLAAADARRLTLYSNAAAVTVTVPTGTFSAGDWFLLQSTGAGGVTLSTSGITLNGSSPNTTIAQNEAMIVVFTAADTVSVIGATAA